MPATSKTKTAKLSITQLKQADTKILQLFPSLNLAYAQNNTQKKAILQKIAYLKIINDRPTANLTDLSTTLKVTRSETTKIAKSLEALSLVKAEKNQSTVYSLTTLGYIALIALQEYRDWAKNKAVLAVPQKKNDPMAYALLVIGFCSNKPEGVYQILSNYASKGNILENIATEVSAEALLGFYRQELRAKSTCSPAYLSVFKEFTTAGFQEVFKMLLLAIKPTAEDYNWLVEFFNEVSEFYFDPSRMAFVNLLPQNQKLQQDLDEFKKAQDQQIKKQDGNLEVTFNIPGSGMSKIEAMPPHLRAIGMRLILEPVKFINKELVNYFWAK